MSLLSRACQLYLGHVTFIWGMEVFDFKIVSIWPALGFLMVHVPGVVVSSSGFAIDRSVVQILSKLDIYLSIIECTFI